MDINLESCLSHLKILDKESKRFVWDPIRKKYVILSPEEFVRQLMVQYLKSILDVNWTNIQIERSISVGDFSRRYDIVICRKATNDPVLLVELKSASVPIKMDVLDQALLYNNKLNASYILISNGHIHRMFKTNHKELLEVSNISEVKECINNKKLNS